MSGAPRLVRRLFSGYYIVAYLLYSALAIPLLALVVAAGAPFRSHRATVRAFRRAITWYGRGVIHILPLGYFRVRYVDEAPDESLAGAVVVMNHRSTSDPYLVGVLEGEIVQVVNLWPMRLPVLGFIARQAGYLSIRAMPPEAFLEQGGRLLADGVAIVAFPEGTRSASRKMGPFHGTVFRLAQEAKAPIVPVCIAGNEKIPPKGSMDFHPGLIRIHKLRALRPAEFAGQDPYHLKQQVRGLIAQRLEELEGPL